MCIRDSGTATRFVPSILEKGILSQTRIYVHLSQDIETAMTVGSRHGEPYVFTTVSYTHLLLLRYRS